MQRSVFVVAVDDGSDVKGWFVIMVGARRLGKTKIVLAADLGDGTDDPRAGRPAAAGTTTGAGSDARRRPVLQSAGPRRPPGTHRLRDRRQADHDDADVSSAPRST